MVARISDSSDGSTAPLQKHTIQRACRPSRGEYGPDVAYWPMNPIPGRSGCTMRELAAEPADRLLSVASPPRLELSVEHPGADRPRGPPAQRTRAGGEGRLSCHGRRSRNELQPVGDLAAPPLGA